MSPRPASPAGRPGGADGDQYFVAAPGAASRPRQVHIDLAGVPGPPLELRTDRSTFSPHHLDPGTRLLLEAGPALPPGAAVLVDAGAGYGPIAVVLARRAPEATVWAVEVNLRARDLCQVNAESCGVADRVRVVAPDEVPSDLVVDQVWSNPPIRVGKPALHAFLLEWLGRLRPDGSAHLVVHKHLGSDSLARWLVEQGHPTERRRSRAGYRLLDVLPAARAAPD